MPNRKDGAMDIVFSNWTRTFKYFLIVNKPHLTHLYSKLKRNLDTLSYHSKVAYSYNQDQGLKLLQVQVPLNRNNIIFSSIAQKRY